jgi:hypothetical protein
MPDQTPNPDAPRYRATAPTYLGRLRDVDDEFFYDGAPNAALEPLNEAAEAAVAAVKAARAERAAKVFVAPLGSALDLPRSAALLPGQDFASMRRRAEEAEFTVAERDEEIVKLKAEVAALKDERDAGKAPAPAKPSAAAK